MARPPSRARGPRKVAETVAQPVKIDNELYVRDYERCVLCYKCVEACGDDAQHTFAIAIAGRGFDARVSTEYAVPLDASACVYCGNCIGVCPTGALMFKSEFDMREAGTWNEATHQTVTNTICPYCWAPGCELELHVQDNSIVKVMSPSDSSVTAGHLARRAGSASSSSSGAGPAERTRRRRSAPPAPCLDEDRRRSSWPAVVRSGSASPTSSPPGSTARPAARAGCRAGGRGDPRRRGGASAWGRRRGRPAAAGPCGARRDRRRRPARGRSSRGSLAVGGADVAIVVGGDMPDLQPEVLRSMLAARLDDPGDRPGRPRRRCRDHVPCRSWFGPGRQRRRPMRSCRLGDAGSATSSERFARRSSIPRPGRRWTPSARPLRDVDEPDDLNR